MSIDRVDSPLRPPRATPGVGQNPHGSAVDGTVAGSTVSGSTVAGRVASAGSAGAASTSSSSQGGGHASPASPALASASSRGLPSLPQFQPGAGQQFQPGQLGQLGQLYHQPLHNHNHNHNQHRPLGMPSLNANATAGSPVRTHATTAAAASDPGALRRAPAGLRALAADAELGSDAFRSQTHAVATWFDGLDARERAHLLRTLLARCTEPQLRSTESLLNSMLDPAELGPSKQRFDAFDAFDGYDPRPRSAASPASSESSLANGHSLGHTLAFSANGNGSAPAPSHHGHNHSHAQAQAAAAAASKPAGSASTTAPSPSPANGAPTAGKKGFPRPISANATASSPFTVSASFAVTTTTTTATSPAASADMYAHAFLSRSAASPSFATPWDINRPKSATAWHAAPGPIGSGALGSGAGTPKLSPKGWASPSPIGQPAPSSLGAPSTGAKSLTPASATTTAAADPARCNSVPADERRRPWATGIATPPTTTTTPTLSTAPPPPAASSSSNSASSSPVAGNSVLGASPNAKRGVNYMDPQLLADMGAWLRSLRLHKYTGNLSNMPWQQVVRLSDAELEARGVNALGARRKMLKMFEDIRAAQAAGELPSA